MGDGDAVFEVRVKLCHCGKPLHYRDPLNLTRMLRLVREVGEFVNVTVGSRTWRVQRHYIALHGIKAKELPALGFEEVKVLARFRRNKVLGRLEQIQ